MLELEWKKRYELCDSLVWLLWNRGYYGNLEGILRRVLRKENGELKASKR